LLIFFKSPSSPMGFLLQNQRCTLIPKILI
jgi:hypothetical protein